MCMFKALAMIVDNDFLADRIPAEENCRILLRLLHLRSHSRPTPAPRCDRRRATRAQMTPYLLTAMHGTHRNARA